VRREQRICSAGTQFYLCRAIRSRAKGGTLFADPLGCITGIAGELDLTRYNDGAGHDEVRALIIEARAIATAELAAEGRNPLRACPPHASTSCVRMPHTRE
jgi:hypothetical protein